MLSILMAEMVYSAGWLRTGSSAAINTRAKTASPKRWGRQPRSMVESGRLMARLQRRRTCWLRCDFRGRKQGVTGRLPSCSRGPGGAVDAAYFEVADNTSGAGEYMAQAAEASRNRITRQRASARLIRTRRSGRRRGR